MTRFEELIRLFKRELQLKKYADSTVETYASCIAVFLRAMAGKPAPLNIEEIKTFLLTIKNQNYHKQFTASIHHFYSKVLKQPLSLQDIPYPRKTNYLPQILSVQETHRLILSIKNLKQKAAIQITYSCGLRISEVVNIQVHHIDGDRNLLLVKGAKGFKDRYVPIPEATLHLLRNYYKQYHPKNYLFEGQFGGAYAVRSLQLTFIRACRMSGIIKKVTPHCLRHSRLTHLKEAGVDIYELKEIAGHNNIKTTEIYLHLAKQTLINRVAFADNILSQNISQKLIA
jgi:site-specific recombinase XerD